MIVINKAKHLMTLARSFWGYKRRKLICSYLPLRLWIEPTNVCNLHCVMCPNSNSGQDIEKGYMDMKLFRKIIDEASLFAYDVNLSHRGESLLHPQFMEMIEYAKSKGLYLRLNTNATLLTEEKSYQLIKSGLDFISFSFDGFDKETYERIRKGAKFESVVSRITNFLKIKKGLKKSTPYTLLEILAFPEVSRERENGKKEDFLKRFQSLPLDEVEVKPLHNWAGNLPSLKEELIPRGVAYTPCTNIWYALVVLWNGSVSPCSQDWYDEFSLGNIKESELSKLWNGKKMVSFRRKIATGKFKEIKICKECNLLWRKNLGGIPVLNLIPFLSENIIGYGNLRQKFKPFERTLLNVRALNARKKR